MVERGGEEMERKRGWMVERVECGKEVRETREERREDGAGAELASLCGKELESAAALQTGGRSGAPAGRTRKSRNSVQSLITGSVVENPHPQRRWATGWRLR